MSIYIYSGSWKGSYIVLQYTNLHGTLYKATTTTTASTNNFSTATTTSMMREKLCLQNLITGSGNFVEKASRALIAALGLADGTLNATNPGIFAKLPKNQKLKLTRGASIYLNDEIDRRRLFYNDYVPYHRPTSWKLEKNWIF